MENADYEEVNVLIAVLVSVLKMLLNVLINFVFFVFQVTWSCIICVQTL